VKREDLTLTNIGELVREAAALAEEEKAIDYVLSSQRPRPYYILSSSGKDVILPVPSDIREMLVKLRKDRIKKRIQEISDLVLPQSR